MSVAVHPLDTPLTRVLGKLKGAKGSREKWTAKCPAHEDTRASLSIGLKESGNVVVRCHAGCTFEQIAAALGMEPGAFFAAPLTKSNGAGPYRPPADRPVLVKTYDYVDEGGQLLYQVCRFQPKDFRPRRPDGQGGWLSNLDDTRRVLYRLPELLEAIAEERPVYLVEGEKDADALAELGYAATTSNGGSESWRESYSEALRGSTVIILPDNDDAGRSYAEQAAASLTNAGCRVRVVPLPGLPAKGDVSDWLAMGNGPDELEREVSRARVWHASPARRLLWRLDEVLENEDIMRPPPVVLPYIAFQGRSTLLAAFEKSGKSTLVSAAIAALSVGGMFLDEPCPKGTTILIGLEEYLGDPGRRLKGYGARGDAVYIADRLPGDAKSRLELIRSMVTEVQPMLVIIDSLTAYSGGQITDASASAQMGPLVQGVTNLAHDTGVAIVILHHARKQDGRYRDSTAIGGAVDILMEISAPDEERDTTLRRARTRGRVPTRGFSYRFDEETQAIYLASSNGQAPLLQRIPEYVRSNPGCTRNQVIYAMRVQRAQTLSAIDHLIRDHQLTDNGTEDRSSLHLVRKGTT